MTSAKKQAVRTSKQLGLLIDEKLLALLACPACQGSVKLQDNKIVCTLCRREYPIVDGIPVLLA
jgi:uncharacterized protein YbaR (Trm112 family)